MRVTTSFSSCAAAAPPPSRETHPAAGAQTPRAPAARNEPSQRAQRELGAHRLRLIVSGEQQPLPLIPGRVALRPSVQSAPRDAARPRASSRGARSRARATPRCASRTRRGAARRSMANCCAPSSIAGPPADRRRRRAQHGRRVGALEEPVVQRPREDGGVDAGVEQPRPSLGNARRRPAPSPARTRAAAGSPCSAPPWAARAGRARARRRDDTPRREQRRPPPASPSAICPSGSGRGRRRGRRRLGDEGVARVKVVGDRRVSQIVERHA